MARVDLRSGDPVPVRELLRDPVVAGVRLVFLPADAGPVDDPAADWFCSFAEEEDVPAMLLASGQLGALGDLARARPGLRLAVDHLGLTRQHPMRPSRPRSRNWWRWRGWTTSRSRRRRPPATAPSPTRTRRCTRSSAAYDAFGPERLFWGSDLSRLRGSYPDLVRLFREELDFLSPADVEAVMGRSVLAWLHW